VNTRRVLVALLLLPIAACSAPDSSPTPSASRSAPFDAARALAASASGVEAGIYSYSVTAPGGSTSRGTLHMPSKSADFQLTLKEDDGTFPIQIRVVDGSNFIKVTYTTSMLRGQTGEAKEIFSGRHWYRVDPRDAGRSDLIVYADSPDVMGLKRFLASTTSTEGDATTIRGTIDGTALGTEEPLIGRKTFQTMPRTAEEVRFTATLDPQGRIAAVTFKLPASADHEGGRWVFTFGDYGTAKPQPAPTGPDVWKASPTFMKFLLSV
jgi:hypothetical protein